MTSADPDYFGGWGDDATRDDRRIREWFDDGLFYRESSATPIQVPQGGTIAEQAEYRRKLVTLIRSTVGAIAPALAPTVSIASPVEVALTDPGTATRYVSSASIAGPADVLLDRSTTALIDPPDTDDDRGIDSTFPPYLLRLPAVLYGKDVDVDIVAIGNGEYTTQYHHRNPAFSTSEPLVGLIATGQTISGSFQLAPEVTFPWFDLGAATAGIAGAPKLVATGALHANDLGVVSLTNARPSAATLFVLSVGSNTAIPFHGGTLVAFPVAFSAFVATSPSGTIQLPYAFPPGVPPGVVMTIQYLIDDAAAVQGIALSNGVQATTP